VVCVRIGREHRQWNATNLTQLLKSLGQKDKNIHIPWQVYYQKYNSEFLYTGKSPINTSFENWVVDKWFPVFPSQAVIVLDNITYRLSLD
jgi:hypothetical protein